MSLKLRGKETPEGIFVSLDDVIEIMRQHWRTFPSNSEYHLLTLFREAKATYEDYQDSK